MGHHVRILRQSINFHLKKKNCFEDYPVVLGKGRDTYLLVRLIARLVARIRIHIALSFSKLRFEIVVVLGIGLSGHHLQLCIGNSGNVVGILD